MTRWHEYCQRADSHFGQVARGINDEERDRGKEKLSLTRPSRHVYRYDLEYLELARQIEDITERPILNPADLNLSALHLADRVWMNDMSAYRRELKFFCDRDKRGKEFRS